MSADRSGRGGRIKGSDQSRQNVVFYRNTALLTNSSAAVASGVINFPTQIVDLKSTVTNPTTDWVFTSPRTRFYKISVWVEFSLGLLTYGLLTSLPAGTSFALAKRSYVITTLLNGVDISSSLVGQLGGVSAALFLDPSIVSGSAYAFLPSTSAHAEGIVRMDAGSILAFRQTFDFTPTYFGELIFGVSAKASVEITEVTPEA